MQLLMKHVLTLVLKETVDPMLCTVVFHLKWDVVQNQTHRITTPIHQISYSAAYGCFGENPSNSPCLTWFFCSSLKKLKMPASCFSFLSTPTHCEGCFWNYFREFVHTAFY